MNSVTAPRFAGTVWFRQPNRMHRDPADAALEKPSQEEREFVHAQIKAARQADPASSVDFPRAFNVAGVDETSYFFWTRALTLTGYLRPRQRK